MKNALVFMLCCLGLAACGQKGPLYLPQPAKPQPIVEPAEAAPDQPAAPSTSPAVEPPAQHLPANPA